MGSQRDVLRGRVAVVTGSTRGLGFAMARLLGQRGATVVLASRSGVDVAAAVDRLHTAGIAASGRRCDTGELADVEALRDEALGRGTLDIWGNNAGASGVFGPTASTPVDDFTRVVRTNILGTFHVTSQPGYEHRLGGLQVVVGLWGQTPDDAARPLLDLVTSDAAEFRYLTKTTMVTRGVRNALAGRLRRAKRMPLVVTVLDPNRKG